MFIPIKIILIFFAFTLLASIIGSITIKNNSLLLTFTLCGFIVAGFLTCIISKNMYDVKFLFQAPDIKQLIIVILIGCTSILIITNIVNYIWAFPLHTTYTKSALYDADSQFENVINYIEALLFAPIVEEFVFRKCCFDAAKNQLNPIAILLITSVLFGFSHPSSFSKISSAFLSGFVFGFIYLKTQNIIYPISAHISCNLALSIFDYLDSNIVKINDIPIATSFHGYVFFNNIIIFVALILFTIAIIILIMYHYKSKLLN
jgi:membrane protease YdiL (CAAX protease family)